MAAADKGDVIDVRRFRWEKLPDMPSARVYSVGGYHEGKLYILGGCDQGGKAGNVAEVYDFAKGEWHQLPGMPTNRVGCTKLVFHDNSIIVIGGVDENQKPVAAVDCFNIEKETWSQLPPLPIGVTGPFITHIENKIYCLGGTDKVKANQCVVFDLDRNEWLNLPPLKYKRYACVGYVYKNKIYIVGGRDVKDPVLPVEVFDLDTQQWEEKAKMPSVRVFYNIVGHEGFIYVFGGLVPMVGMSKIAEKYDIEKDEWCRMKDLNTPITDGAIGVVSGRVVMAAGLSLEGPRSTVVTINEKGDGWENMPRMKVSRASTSYLQFDDKLAVIGGVCQGGPQPVVEILGVKNQ